MFHSHPVKLYYITQIAVGPPTFVLFSNVPEGVTESYRRYLVRRLREEFGFEGTPLRLLIRQRQKENPNSRREKFQMEGKKRRKRSKK